MKKKILSSIYGTMLKRDIDEWDDEDYEYAAYLDERAARYGFGSIKEMNDFIKELNEEVNK